MVTVATENQTVIIHQEKCINVIHHDDAGAVNESGVILETIEFPPAYNNIRNTPQS